MFYFVISLSRKRILFHIIVIAHSLQFSTAAATANMTDSSRYEYDWRRRLSHVNMTDSDLTKYDWRRRPGDGCSGDYYIQLYMYNRANLHAKTHFTSLTFDTCCSKKTAVKVVSRKCRTTYI